MGNHQAFRANVGVVVINAQRHVAAFERKHQPGSWQLPQGGLDVGEDLEDAAYRELEEETGLTRDDVELLGVHPRWLAYDLPPKLRRKHWRGQVQRWFLFRLRDGKSIDLTHAEDDEFAAHRWMPMRQLIDEVWAIRRPIYEEVAAYFEL
jgi:putative (di)nucleoside polyphosphate hydrolase